MKKCNRISIFHILVFLSLIIFCDGKTHLRTLQGGQGNKKTKAPVPAPSPVAAPTPPFGGFVKVVDLEPFYLTLTSNDDANEIIVDKEQLQLFIKLYFDFYFQNNDNSYSLLDSEFSATILSDANNNNRKKRRILVTDSSVTKVVQIDGSTSFDKTKAPTKPELDILVGEIFGDEFVNVIEIQDFGTSIGSITAEVSFTNPNAPESETIGGGSNAGGISGGVIGAVAVMCMASLAYIKYKQKRHNVDKDPEKEQSTTPSPAKYDFVKRNRNNNRSERKKNSKRKTSTTDVVANNDGSVFETVYSIPVSSSLKKFFNPSNLNKGDDNNNEADDDDFSLNGSVAIDESKPNIGDKMLNEVLALSHIDADNLVSPISNLDDTHGMVDSMDMSNYTFSHESNNPFLFSAGKLQSNRNADEESKFIPVTPNSMDYSEKSETSSLNDSNVEAHFGIHRVVETELASKKTESTSTTTMIRLPSKTKQLKISVITEAPTTQPPLPQTPDRFPIQAANKQSQSDPYDLIDDDSIYEAESVSSVIDETNVALDDGAWTNFDVSFGNVKQDTSSTKNIKKEVTVRPPLANYNHPPPIRPNYAIGGYNRQYKKDVDAYDSAKARNARINRLTKSIESSGVSRKNDGAENHSQAILASTLRRSRLQQQRIASSPPRSRQLRNKYGNVNK